MTFSFYSTITIFIFLTLSQRRPLFRGEYYSRSETQHSYRSLQSQYKPFLAYLESRDRRFPLHPELWLTSLGRVPTRHWFISRLRKYFPKEIAGQSLRSGGATSLAEAGADLATIQAAGRWASRAFRIYIRKNPVVLHAIIFGRPTHQRLNQTLFFKLHSSFLISLALFHRSAHFSSLLFLF